MRKTAEWLRRIFRSKWPAERLPDPAAPVPPALTTPEPAAEPQPALPPAEPSAPSANELGASFERIQSIVADLMARERTITRGLRAIIEAADELIRCDDLDLVHRRTVELARERLGVERCALYLLDASRQYLAGTYGTDGEGRTTDERTNRVTLAESPEILSPTDHLWTVYQSARVYHDATGRHQVGDGWVAATLIRSAAQPIGVFYNDSARSAAPLDEAVQETLALYASLLGNILERKRAVQREREMAQALSGILEAADELIGLTDVDTLYRRAVELAREKLGLERSAIFLLDASRELLRGTYGTDPQGRTTDEHAARWCARDRPEVFEEQGDRWMFTNDTRSYWEGDRCLEIGTGWVAFTSIRVGGELLGFMTSDAAISGRPPNETTQEATSLYCSLLGHIAKRLSGEAEREKLITELEAKNAELERFTYTVSHDLKSPLITIRGFIGFLERDLQLGDDSRLRADIARIAEASSKMQRLLDELLDLSRIGRLVSPPEPVPLGAIVADALALVEGRIAERGVTVEVAEPLPVVYGDRARLVEVVQNLVDNAVKFLGEQPAPKVEIGARELDGRTELFVRDNGQGIDARFHQRIFGLFNKLDARSEGTGVGLALAKRIVEVHGGRIWVESEGRPGLGATFWVTLPVGPETLEARGGTG